MSTNPGGDALASRKLRAGDARARIDPRWGGRLASLEIGGRELLIGRGTRDAPSMSWGCYLMAPWPGRLADGRLRWRGRTIQLPRTYGRHAIHGLVHGVPWVVERSTDTEVQLSIELRPLGWPFDGRIRQRYLLEPGRLRLEASIEADEPMPAALGWHPWFDRRGTDPVVTIDADHVLVTRDMIPTLGLSPVRARTDLRAGVALGSRRLDHAYVDARSPARIRWPGLDLELGFDPSPATLVVFSPPDAVCVEPQTAWPNALGLEDNCAIDAGRRDLAAGESLRATLAFGWR